MCSCAFVSLLIVNKLGFMFHIFSTGRKYDGGYAESSKLKSDTRNCHCWSVKVTIRYVCWTLECHYFDPPIMNDGNVWNDFVMSRMSGERCLRGKLYRSKSIQLDADTVKCFHFSECPGCHNNQNMLHLQNLWPPSDFLSCRAGRDFTGSWTRAPDASSLEESFPVVAWPGRCPLEDTRSEGSLCQYSLCVKFSLFKLSFLSEMLVPSNVKGCKRWNRPQKRCALA